MRTNHIVLAGFLILLMLGPVLLPEFYITLLNYIGLYSLVAMGLVLLTGIGGLTSFGQAAFVGLGAYASCAERSPAFKKVNVITANPWSRFFRASHACGSGELRWPARFQAANAPCSYWAGH